MSRLKIKKETIYLGILVFSLMGGFAIIQSCAKEKGKTVTDISSLPPNERTEVLQVQDSSLGEVAIISNTELDHGTVESSLREVDIITGRLITARAPNLPLPTETDEQISLQDLAKELKFERFIISAISDEAFEKFGNFQANMKLADNLSDRYLSILSIFVNQGFIFGCLTNNRIESSCLAPQMSNCEIKVLDCRSDSSGGIYSLSATVYASLQGDFLNYSYSVSIVYAEVKKRGNSIIVFREGHISGWGRFDSSTGTFSTLTNIKNISILDIEEGVEILGSLEGKIQMSPHGGVVETTFDNIGYKKDGKTFMIEGKLTAESKGVKDGSADINARAEDLKFKIGDEEILTINGVAKKSWNKELEVVLREASSQISFSSPANSFSAEFFRFKKVQREKNQGENTFSISITSYIKVGGKEVKRYSHNLLISRGEQGEFKVNGEIKVVKKDGTDVQIKLENVKVEKDCQNLTSGTISADVKKDKKVVKVKATLSQTCSCEHEVEVEKDGKLIKSVSNICEAKKKAEAETVSDIVGGAT
jgi:hypothetical protein